MSRTVLADHLAWLHMVWLFAAMLVIAVWYGLLALRDGPESWRGYVIWCASTEALVVLCGGLLVVLSR